MSQPAISLDGDLETGTVTITHGGAEGTQRRAAVLDDDGVVVTTALVPADWAEQDPGARWQPTGDVVLLDGDEQAVGPGWRRDGNRWVEPAAPTEPEPAPVPNGTVAYGEVTDVDPLTVTVGNLAVPAGRLAGYTPEVKHKVKLSRISGQWVVEDRVLLHNA